MMTDKELLELAAKAAGINTLIWHDEMQSYWISYDAPQYWNPLTDDGAALRLAVKLGLTVHVFPENIFVGQCHTSFTELDIDEVYTGDPYAATRRAIVRAAAEIWKGRT